MKKLLAGDGCDCYINVPGAARIDPHIVKRKRGVDPRQTRGKDTSVVYIRDGAVLLEFQVHHNPEPDESVKVFVFSGTMDKHTPPPIGHRA